MHSLLVLLSVVGALSLRWTYLWSVENTTLANSNLSWSRRWSLALGAFVLPPLLILAMAIAVLTMGIHGSMLGHAVGHLGYGCALLLVTLFAVTLLWLGINALRSQGRLRNLPLIEVQGVVARRLETELPFAARVGFWRPALVLSRGLDQLLSETELDAVLRHEQAHLIFRDTFWFFWLGWLRTATLWLPGTRILWKELLLLREMRADRWAAQGADPILLAESLLKMARAAVPAEPGWVMFSEGNEGDRLEQRIDALLATEPQVDQADVASRWVMVSFAIAALPLLTNLWHSAA